MMILTRFFMKKIFKIKTLQKIAVCTKIKTLSKPKRHFAPIQDSKLREPQLNAYRLAMRYEVLRNAENSSAPGCPEIVIISNCPPCLFFQFHDIRKRRKRVWPALAEEVSDAEDADLAREIEELESFVTVQVMLGADVKTLSLPVELSEEALVQQLLEAGFQAKEGESTSFIFIIEEKARPIAVNVPGSAEKMISFASGE